MYAYHINLISIFFGANSQANQQTLRMDKLFRDIRITEKQLLANSTLEKRDNLLTLYEDFILLFPVDAVSKQITDSLWKNLFYVKTKFIQSSISRAKKEKAQKNNEDQISLLFQQLDLHLESAAEFYNVLVLQLKCYLEERLAENREGSCGLLSFVYGELIHLSLSKLTSLYYKLEKYINHHSLDSPTDDVTCLYILFTQCLSSLADITRYQELYSGNESGVSKWTSSITICRKILMLNPTNGMLLILLF